MDELVHSNDAAFLLWATIRFRQKKIATSILDAYLATNDVSVSAIQNCVTINYYYTEPMPAILCEADKF